jgi:hypothetical protein
LDSCGKTHRSAPSLPPASTPTARSNWSRTSRITCWH